MSDAKQDDRSAAREGRVPSALPGPLARASVVALVGAAVLVAVGAILASPAVLLFVAGLLGASVGLVLARAGVSSDGARALLRRTVGRLAVGMSVGAVGVAAVGMWLVARSQGGTLDLLDYLWTVFGPLVPAEAIAAGLAAAWGAGAGPVRR